MNICFFGQGTGGNAMLWFDFFNHRLQNYSEVKQFTLLCRTKCTLEAKFHVVKSYGTGRMPKWVYRFYAPWVSRIGLRLRVKFLTQNAKYDILHLQGNYNPGLNLQLMNAFKCKTVLNIYGSDFYRQYLLAKFSTVEKARFEEVVKRADHIVCNWITTQNDFIKAFPETVNKCSTHLWGYDQKWRRPVAKLEGWPEAEKVFLSARGIYDYNNIDIVVEAFCLAYRSKPEYKLFLINGYGNHLHAIKKIEEIIAKYNAGHQVIMRVGQWIEDKELMSLYGRADYNICFGSTDQLTVSICYGCEKEAINILSPLKNYYDLSALGYKSLQIVEELSVEALTRHFENLHLPPMKALIEDKKLIRKHFNMQATFDDYMNIYRSILNASTNRIKAS